MATFTIFYGAAKPIRVTGKPVQLFGYETDVLMGKQYKEQS